MKEVDNVYVHKFVHPIFASQTHGVIVKFTKNGGMTFFLKEIRTWTTEPIALLIAELATYGIRISSLGSHLQNRCARTWWQLTI